MSSFLEIKRKARRLVHEHLHIDSFIYKCQDTFYASGTSVRVRLHYDYGLVGNQPGTNFQYAEATEMSDAVAILYTSDYPSLENGDIIATERGDAYRVEMTDPADDETTKAHLTKMHIQESRGVVPYPGGLV